MNRREWVICWCLQGAGFSRTDTFSKGKVLILACFVHPQVRMRWQETLTSILGHRTLRNWVMILCPPRATWASVLEPAQPGIVLLPFFIVNWRQPWFFINQNHFHFSHYPQLCSLDEDVNLVKCSHLEYTCSSVFFRGFQSSILCDWMCWSFFFFPTLWTCFKHRG